MTADSSITNQIPLWRAIATSIGGDRIDETTTTDLSGYLVINTYVGMIVKGFGEEPEDNTGLDTDVKAIACIARNIHKIAESVS